MAFAATIELACGSAAEAKIAQSELRRQRASGLFCRRFHELGDGKMRNNRLIALAADLVMSPFGTRNQLYERLQSGEPDTIRRRLFADFKETAPLWILLVGSFFQGLGGSSKLSILCLQCGIETCC